MTKCGDELLRAALAAVGAFACGSGIIVWLIIRSCDPLGMMAIVLPTMLCFAGCIEAHAAARIFLQRRRHAAALAAAPPQPVPPIEKDVRREPSDETASTDEPV